MASKGGVSGLTKNIFHLIEGSGENLGKDAITTQNLDAKDGVLASVKGPNQVIMDTGYFPMNELLGLHQLKITWFSDIDPGTVGLQVQYWKKGADGVEYLSQSVDVANVENLSNNTGNGIGYCYFPPNYQYKIKVVSSPNINPDDWVKVDYISLTPQSEWGVASHSLVSSDPSKGPIPLTTHHASIIVYGNNSPTGIGHYSFGITSDDPFKNCDGGINIQLTVNSTNTSIVYVAHMANLTSEGFDIVVGVSGGGNWTGNARVHISMASYVPTTTI